MRRLFGALAAASIVFASCSTINVESRSAATSATTISSPQTANTQAQQSPFAPGEIEWRSCGSNVECGSLDLPLDYADPTGPTIAVALARRPATNSSERIGSLLMNPGGPGGSGVKTVLGGFRVSSEISQRFDLVSWDPRGVGSTSPVLCGLNDVATLLAADPSPNDADARAYLEASAQALAQSCEEEAGDLLPFVGTNSTVKDMEQIRVALGDEPMNYLGLSYGTMLGQEYLAAYPGNIRAMTLDGVVDPDGGIAEFARGQAQGFEAALQALFDSCSSGGCPLADPAGAFKALSERLEQVSIDSGDGRTLGPAELQIAATFAGYSEGNGQAFLRALADAGDGDGRGIVDLADSYYGIAPFSQYLSIICLDLGHPDPHGFAELSAEMAEQAPIFGSALAYELLSCAYWAEEPSRDSKAVDGVGGPAILVIGTTGDPATPFEQAQRVDDRMDNSVLLTFEGSGHLATGRNTCVNDWITRYFVGLVLPPPGTVC